MKLSKITAAARSFASRTVNKGVTRVALPLLIVGFSATIASATPPADFTPPTGFGATDLVTSVVVANKALILGGAAAVVFLMIVAGVIRGLRKGSVRTAGNG